MAPLLATGAAACSSGGSSSSVAASSSQAIVFAESGLGTEGQQTQKAINAFEAANPNIKVTIQVLSSDSTTYLSQLEHDFISGSSTPDVFESDVTYPAKFAQAGWVLPLTPFKVNARQFFQTEIAAGTYNGTLYGVPWFDNPEGLYYRTDLIKTPPTSPAEVVTDAEAAMTYFAQVKTLNSYAAPRPVSPNYLAVSADLQTLFSSVYANPGSDAASSAFTAGAATIKSDANATPGS
jgi:multiple sugar transport system substrate-binding protein